MIRTLSCHCGAIRLECNAPLERLRECNCSTCGRHGWLHWYVKPEQVRLAQPSRGLATYAWREAFGGHHFCPTCGAGVFRTGSDNYLSLNARCLDGVDVFTLQVERYDGLHDLPGGAAPPLADPHAPDG